MDTDYLVRWEVNVTAATPQEAAKQALAMQRDVHAQATFFDVFEEAHLDADPVEVDLGLGVTHLMPDPSVWLCELCVDAYRNGIEPGESACENAQHDFMQVVVNELYCPGSMHSDYPLLRQDVVRRESDGTWFKIANGLGIGGFKLPTGAGILRPIDPANFDVVIESHLP
jgi:hypothetical protein